MSQPEIAAIILAAGKGTRMKSTLPKVLHRAAGLPLAAYPLRRAIKLGVKKIVLIVSKDVGDEVSEVMSHYGKFETAIQDPPLGTGHAVMAGMKKLENFSGHVLILYGDVPLLKAETLERLINEHIQSEAALTFASAILDKPINYGRIIRSVKGEPVDIIEDRDATPQQKTILEMNAGLYIAESGFLRSALEQLKNENEQKEYYLTDLIKIAAHQGSKVSSIQIDDLFEWQGVNNPEEFSRIENHIFTRRTARLMRSGVRIVRPETVVVDSTVTIEEGTTICGPCYLKGKTKIGKNCMIEMGSVIRDSIVGEGVFLKAHCYLLGARVEEKAIVGPFAHLRPESVVGKNAHVGNFVELKKTTLGEGSKANHLSYLGDATIGKNVNIGAGTITCNYDGKAKHQTILEDGVFVGSDTQFVAPLSVGKGAYIGAGSTITKNVSPGALALSRTKQTEVKNWGAGKEKPKKNKKPVKKPSSKSKGKVSKKSKKKSKK